MNLKLLRTSKNKTQKEMADYLKIARTTYSAYEQQANQPDIETLKKLAEFYQVSLDYLCDFNPPYLLNLPALNEEQKEIINLILKLKQNDLMRVKGYIEGLKDKQLSTEEKMNKILDKFNLGDL